MDQLNLIKHVIKKNRDLETMWRCKLNQTGTMQSGENGDMWPLSLKAGERGVRCREHGARH